MRTPLQFLHLNRYKNPQTKHLFHCVHPSLSLALSAMTPSSDDGGGGGNVTAEHRTAPPPRSRHRLHNFNFPTLRWGTQRILRCKSPLTASTSHHHHQKPQSNHDDEPQPSAAARSPWNLRTRRFRSSGNAPSPQHQGSDKSRNNDSTANKSPSPEEKSEEEKGLGRAKFSVELTREEIEEDFLRMKGARPLRRPKKRARIVQRKLDVSIILWFFGGNLCFSLVFFFFWEIFGEVD